MASRPRGRTTPWKWTIAGTAFALFAVLLQAFHAHDVARAAAPQDPSATSVSADDGGSVPYVPPYATGGFYRDIQVPAYGGGGYGYSYGATPTHTRTGPS